MFRRINNYSIRRKIVLYAYIILIPVLLIAGTILFFVRYRSGRTAQLDSYQQGVQNLSDGLDNLLENLNEFSTYLMIDQSIENLLKAPNASVLNEDSQVWLHNAPLGSIESIVALSGQIKTVAIYPENGLRMYQDCTDNSSFITEMDQVRETRIYQQMEESEYYRLLRWVSRETNELFSIFRTDKLLLVREMYDLSRRHKRGFLIVGANMEKYNQLCENFLQDEKDRILVFSEDGKLLFHAGEFDDALSRQMNGDLELSEMEEKELLPEFARKGGYGMAKGYQVFAAPVSSYGLRAYWMIPVETLRRQIISSMWEPILMLLCFLIGILPILMIVSVSVTKPLMELSRAMNKFKDGDFDQQVPVRSGDEVGQVSENFNRMVHDMKGLIDQRYVAEIRRQESELNLLQAQINPHFLYNTLDTIYWQAENEGSEEVAEQILALSNLFRLVLSQGNDFVRIENELNLIRQYLKIQEMRFTENLFYEIEMEDTELAFVEIPKLVLQPFVENAVVHGFESRGEKCLIRVSVARNGDRVRIEISDNGSGMTKEELKKIMEDCEDTSTRGHRVGTYAIYNVRERLNLYYHENYLLDITSEPGKGTTVILEIPEKSEV